MFGDSIALNNNDISNVGSLTASGNITGSYFIGNGYSLTSINSSNISGTVANATYATSAGSATTAGTVTTAAQPNITSVGTLTTLTTSGQILLSSSTGRVLSGVDAGGSISLGLNDGNSSSPYLDFNTSNTAVDFNVRIQATGASAGTAGGNLYFYGAHFNYSNANIVIADTTSTAGSRNNFRITNSPYAFGILGRAGPGNYNPIVANNDVVLYSSNTSSQGNSSITLTTWANVEGGINVKSTNQLTDITIRGNTVSFYGDIVNGQANGVGNIGNATTYFNTVFAKATSAQYADVAEFYRADADYPVGTVLEFGGNQEVTAAVSNHTTAVAGTVSESPAVIMNSGLQHEHRTAVALLGRVPCRVVGSIQKGDRLAASHLPGVATALDLSHYQPGCIIGKALENYDSDEEGVIEIVVGRL